ncbi:hypothetical protein G5714_014798 [Onychostoma macrolepis]|uniref:Beta-defensin n=1 Tax=Onychostoma macrolepis TaxID=369639 RepID=A0A7J6C9S5_9TELE|nr:hypothetical protein G5714_014798 [Onychostoma macrolepis]
MKRNAPGSSIDWARSHPPSPPPELLYNINVRAASRLARDAMSYNMRTLGLIIITLLLLTAGEADETDVQGWTCGYRGLCRKHCYAQEYMIGYHGCPRRYRCCALRF